MKRVLPFLSSHGRSVLCIVLCGLFFVPLVGLAPRQVGAVAAGSDIPKPGLRAPAPGLPDLNITRQMQSFPPTIAAPIPSALRSHSPYDASRSVGEPRAQTGAESGLLAVLYQVGSIVLNQLLGPNRPAPGGDLFRTHTTSRETAANLLTPQATNYSLSLNGVDGAASIPNSSSLNITSSITVEAWIKYSSLPASNVGIAERYKDLSAPEGGFALRLLTTGKVRFYLLKNGFDAFTVASSATVTTGGWHHIAGVFDGSSARIYIDGVLDISKATTFAPGTGTSNVFIGRTAPGGGFFNGLIDEVRLTAASVYSSNFTPQPHLTQVSGIRGLWKFDSQTVADSSGNGNNGSLIGGASFSTDVPGGGAPNQPPTVSITSPADNASFTAPANITINANASDSDGSVSKVDFYAGAFLIGTDTTSPYSFAWNNVAAGNYQLSAVATDNANAATTSSYVNIAVANAPGNNPPLVSLTSPAPGATFSAPANISLGATASDSDGTISRVEFYNGTFLIGTDTTSPYSFAWNNVAAGSYSLTAKAIDNLSASTTSNPPVGITVGGQTPFNPPHNAPGLVQAEDFDNGGESVAYHDLSPGNDFGAYRVNTDVDIYGPTADAGGGFELANVVQTEWVEYTINVTTSQNYDIQARVASGGPGGVFHYDFDNGAVVTSGVTVPNTGDWGVWQTVTKSGVFLSAGQHVMRVAMDVNGTQQYPAIANFNYFNFVVASGSGQTPFLGSPFQIPGLIQMEDFDNGGEGVAYHDTAPGNDWGQYRTNVGVDIAICSEGGYEIGNAVATEWLEYTVNVATIGTYDIQTRVASGGPGGVFHVEIDGIDKTGPMTVPNTGSWGTYQTVTKTGVSLTSGQHILRVSLDANGTQQYPAIANFNSINITAGGVSPNYQGFHDTADCNFITGWAWNANLPNTPISVDIYDSSIFIATVPANQFRQDLLNAGIGNGVHAFSFATPTIFINGLPHSITIKFAGTTTNLASTPRSILCGAPPTTNFQAALADPDNRIGSPGEDLFSGNYNWSVPILELSGRAGLDIGLPLSYNSLVWTKSGSSIKFNADNGFPSAGFRLGFPVVQSQKYISVSGAPAYLMIMPSGSRVELRQVSTGLFQAADSSYLQLIETGTGGLVVRGTDGSQHTYVLGIDSNEYECSRIQDRNGNFITIAYAGNDRIQTITDTLGRVITFGYTGTNLTSITQPWKDGQHTWATFTYTDRIIQSNFTGLTVIAPSQAIPMLTQVGLDDGSRITFDYTSWGQVYKITTYAADNHQLNYTSYDLPETLSAQTDCPRFGMRKVFAENWNNNVPVPTQFFFEKVAARTDVTLPDGTVYKEFFGPNDWQRGLTTRTETWSVGALKKWTTVSWTQDVLPGIGETILYRVNPRQTETNVYDDVNNVRRTIITYISVALPNGTLCYLPKETFEYGAGGTSVLRKSVTDYHLSSAYLNNHIIGLPSGKYLYEEASGPLMSKVTYEYDLSGEYLVNQGTPVQHMDVGYTTGRGNLCLVRRWDVNSPNDINQSIPVNRTGYNTTGSRVFFRDALGHESRISYADSFLDSAAGTTLAYPTTVTDADGFNATFQYRRDLGVVSRTQDPKGAIQTTAYDSAGRVQRIDISNGAYRTYTYPTTGTSLVTHALLQVGSPEFFSSQELDGAGRVRATASDFPGSVGRYRARWIIYDVMGRPSAQSNPTEITGAWIPGGDDAADGWRFVLQTYDWQGRPLVTTNTDNTTHELSYEGCGCAGVQVVTSKDEAGRRQKSYRDPLGRVTKSEVLNSDQSVFSTTVSTYNARDQVLNIKQHAGVNGTFEEAIVTYDGHSRVFSRHVPAYGTNRTTKYFYNADDTVQEVRDPRNASKFPGYNGRHLVTSVNYGVLTGSTIPVTPPVSFTYDEAGNRTAMTDGAGGTIYEYDTWSRLFRETRTFTGLGSYALNYTYNLDGGLKSITDTLGGNVAYSYDSAGQLTGVGGARTYATDIQYRAWGAMKGLTYGNALTLGVSFNNRLQTSHFEVKQGATMKLGWDYHYNSVGSNDNDGRVKFSDNLTDNNYDRGFVYDHAGRLIRGTTGGEARGETNPGPRPYTQTYGYDVWDNMVARTYSTWVIVNGTPQHGAINNYSATYINDRNQAWTYDFAGNPLSGDGQQFTFDAAGQRTAAQPSSGGQGTQFSMLFDGDGHEVQNLQGTNTTYYLRSSVLGKLVIADISAVGSRIRGYVYAGADLLATEDSSSGVSWRHDDPTNTSNQTTDSNRNISTQVQLDPLGVKVDPLIVNTPPPLPTPPTYYGNPNPAMGCRLDGAPASCSLVLGLLHAESAVRCPPGGCGLATLWSPTQNRFVGFQFFRAQVDGHAGFMPFNATYTGEGRYTLPRDPEDERSGGEFSVDETTDPWNFNERLADSLLSLGNGCKEFFGGWNTLRNRATEIQNGDVLFLSRKNLGKWLKPIPKDPQGRTYSQWLKDRGGNGGSTAMVLHINGQAQPYNTIFIFEEFFYPSWDNKARNLHDTLDSFQRVALVHEYMHILNNMSDVDLKNDWQKKRAVFDDKLRNPSLQIQKFIFLDCPTRDQ